MGLAVIGGEGALVLGGLAALQAARAVPGWPGAPMLLFMAAAAMATGGLVVALAGWLRAYRGVNETIGSLLITYIALAVFNQLVEGPLRDPADVNKPSTFPLPLQGAIGTIDGSNVHWGIAVGVAACIAAYVLVFHTVPGFSLRIAGGNVRAAQMVGLPVARMTVAVCFVGGAAAGLAGMIEVAAINGKANSSLIAGYGFTGILISFIARHNPLVIIPAALLLGGISASGGLIQRRLGLPDAAVLVLQGTIFLFVLTAETLRGRDLFGLMTLIRARGEPAPSADALGQAE
jgi:simple sugar transport system permease protein